VGRIPKPRGYPENPQTLGEHLKCRRLDEGLSQPALARRLGVHPATLRAWERGRYGVGKKNREVVFEFLGGDPRG